MIHFSACQPWLSATLTSNFIYHQTLGAAYAQYQQEFGEKWFVLIGVRSETLWLDTDLTTSNASGRVTYTKLNPSIFATYVVSSKSRLRFSYGHHLERPAPLDLNPFITIVNAQHVVTGNPELQPQETDKLTADYDRDSKGTSFGLHTFYTRDNHLIIPKSVFITDPQNSALQVLDTTRVNSGFGDVLGAEATLGTQFAGRLYINANVTAQLVRIRSPEVAGVKSETPISGGLNFSYTVNSKDSVSFSYNAIGKRLTGEGYSTASGIDSLFYVHRLTPKIQITLRANNLFRMNKSELVTKTNSIMSRSTNVS